MTSQLNILTKVGYLAMIINYPDIVQHAHGYIISHPAIDEPAKAIAQKIKVPAIGKHLVQAILDNDEMASTILARALQLSLPECDFFEVHSDKSMEEGEGQVLSFAPADLSRPLDERLAEHKTYCMDQEAAIEHGWLPPTLGGVPVDEDEEVA